MLFYLYNRKFHNYDLMVKTEYTENLAKDTKIFFYNNGLHSVVFRLQAAAVFFFIKGFDSCGVI